MERVFVDANVLMEVVFKRQKFHKVVDILANPIPQFVISPLSVNIVYHFCQKDGLNSSVFTRLANNFLMLPITQQTVELAQKRYNGKDFEDCLQAATAELGNCQQIITLDRNFARDSGTNLPVTLV